MRQDLLELENLLLDDSRGFGFLLSILPKDLFLLHNGNVRLDPKYSLSRNVEQTPIFAFMDSKQALNLTSWNPKQTHDYSNFAWSTSNGEQKFNVSDDLLHELNEAPPLSWIDDPLRHWSGSETWARETDATIKYFFLAWASDAGHNVAWVPPPDYQNLTGLFEKLMQTRHYHQSNMRHDNEKLREVFMSPSESEGLRALSHGYKEEEQVNDKCMDELKIKNTTHYAGDKNDPSAVLLTSTQDFNGSLAFTNTGLMIDIAESPSHYGGTDSSPKCMNNGHYDTSMDVDESEAIQEPLQGPIDEELPPTPDTMREDSTPVTTDACLIELRNNIELLPFLPNLNTLQFKRYYSDDDDFLPLRLLIGTFKRTAQPDLSGQEAWAIFKLHDKDARAAPRMQLFAYSQEDDNLIKENLNLKGLLLHVDLIAAFKGIYGGAAREELQLKAVVKYYFVLAANARVLDFTQHHMPINKNFIDNLAAVCKRIRDRVETMDIDLEPDTSSRLPSVSDGEDIAATGSGQRAVRSVRPNRRIRNDPRLSAAVESEAYDSASPAVEDIAQRYLSRRLALGTARARLAEVDGQQINEFLDSDTGFASSEGESGDEIPALLSKSADSLLKKRTQVNSVLNSHRDLLQNLKARNRKLEWQISRLKGQCKRTEDAAEAATLEQDLWHKEQQLRAIQSQMKVKENAIKGFKETKKRLDDEIDTLDKKGVETWKEMQR